MTSATLFHEIDNTPRAYAWGQVDGISRVRRTAATGERQAELWLGAHPSAPSRIVGDAPWSTLRDWEDASGVHLPFLLKILCAAEPLSLQAHPSAAQAAEGFARENALGVPLDAPHRSYRDPHSKPELIVALHDGFEALCGFREVDDVLADLRFFEGVVDPAQRETLETWRTLLAGDDGIRTAFLWLLSGDAAVDSLVAAIVSTRAGSPRAALLDRVCAAHPGDPGILGALMLQHLTLRSGEALWLPAGNIHAYLFGSGIELMGPSDNVLRGGLTPKHIDTVELGRVLDARPGADPHLTPEVLGEGIRLFRPGATGEGPGFALHAIEGTGDVTLPGPAIALATDGAFTLSADAQSIEVPRGRAVLITRAAAVQVAGGGRLFIASS